MHQDAVTGPQGVNVVAEGHELLYTVIISFSFA